MEDLEDRLRSARNPLLQKKSAEPGHITISTLEDHAGPPVALEFVHDEMNRIGGFKDAWSADLPWAPGLPHYRVYVNPANEEYAYMRPADPDAGTLAGLAENLDAAMRVCAGDVVKLARRRRWQQYMLHNEPPETD